MNSDVRSRPDNSIVFCSGSYLLPRSVPTVSRVLQRDVIIDAQGEQLLPAINSVFEAPQLTPSRGNNEIQAVAVIELAGLGPALARLITASVRGIWG